jgi:hypothetical protein
MNTLKAADVIKVNEPIDRHWRGNKNAMCNFMWGKSRRSNTALVYESVFKNTYVSTMMQCGDVKDRILEFLFDKDSR